MTASLPPHHRSHIASGLTSAAVQGRFELQVCRECARVQYPPREACSSCLSVRLDWKTEAGQGELISETTLAHSYEPYFSERLPWRVGLVRLDSGPIVITHMDAACAGPPSRVRVGARLDEAGLGVLIAFPVEVSGDRDE
jgi:uncharacterized OB-fold protein